MASLEADFLSRTLRDADTITPLDFGITEEHFYIPEMRQGWKWILKSWRSKQGLPSVNRFERAFPNVDLAAAPDCIEALCVELLQRRARDVVQAICLHAEERLEEPGVDPIDVMLEVQRESAAASSNLKPMSVVNMGSSAVELMEEYNDAEAGKGIPGIPYPWSFLNKETGGMAKGDFTLFWGRPKSMKTWLAIHIAANAYWNHHYRVLFYTREMKPLAIRRRAATAIAGADYKGVIKGRLPVANKKKYFDVLKHLPISEAEVKAHLGRSKYFIITSDRSVGGGGVMALRAMVEKYRPDLLVVDGVYMLKNDRGTAKQARWEKTLDICGDLKDLAMDFDNSVLGTTQENREGEGKKVKSLGNIAFGDAYGMYCDMGACVVKKRTHDGRYELSLHFPGSRESDVDGFVIGGHPAVDFHFRRVIREKTEEEEAEATGGRRLG